MDEIVNNADIAVQAETIKNAENSEEGREPCKTKKEDKEKRLWTEQYDLWEYFKNNTALIIAGVSAIIAIVSFALSAIAYGKDIVFLQYWRIDAHLANLSGNEPLYCVAASLLYCLAALFSSAYIMIAFISSRHQLSFVCAVQHITKNSVRSLRRRQKIVRENIGKPWQSFEEFEKLKRVKEANQELSYMIKEQKNLMYELLWEECKRIFSKTMLAAVLQLIGVSILTLYSGSIGKSTILMWLAILITDIVLLVMLYLKIRKKVINKLKEFEHKTDDEIQYLKEMSEKAKRVKDSLSLKGLRNLVFVQIAYSLVICLGMTAFGEIAGNGWGRAFEQKEFDVFRDQQGIYAILYHSENACIMESIEIRDTTIIIDTSHQRIYSSSDIEFERMKFENVIKVPSDDEELDSSLIEDAIQVVL